MANKKLDQLILQLENYIEVWKQFNNYIALARSKKFQPEDENQFLEIKSVIAQELEMILSVIESGTPTKEDVHGLIGSAPSIRYMSELPEGSLRAIENQWHKSFISWQSILGQLKVQQRADEGKGFFSMFSKK